MIDVSFRMYSDTPLNKDPDKYSPTLKRYHQILWSKLLPEGTRFVLTKKPSPDYLYHESSRGVFHISSDAITHSYRNVKRMKHVTSFVPDSELEMFQNVGSTIGAYTIFPGKKIGNSQTINQARGCRVKIADRFDLTLECIRRHYLGEESPLARELETYGEFFALFETFHGYVDFFLFNDLVEGNNIKFYLPFDGFQRNGYPNDLVEYLAYMHATMEFVAKRNRRIIETAYGSTNRILWNQL